MDEERLIATLKQAVYFLKHAPLESGVCCCGSPIEQHGSWENHSPVDDLSYRSNQLLEEFEAILKERVK